MIEAINSYVFLKPVQEDQSTEGGILLATNAKNTTAVGEVVYPKDLFPNASRVFYNKNEFTKIHLNGEDLVVGKYEHIYAVLKVTNMESVHVAVEEKLNK